MTHLREIQTALHHFLQGKSSAIESYVVGKDAKEVKRRLSIYQEAYQLRLEDNLYKQYPILLAWVRKERFSILAKGYDQIFPPNHYAIRHYGENFSRYLKSIDEDFLSALAEFEWAIAIALDNSPDAKIMTAKDFQALTTEALLAFTFHFTPSLQRLALHYDIPSFWEAMKKTKLKSPPAYSENALSIWVWRKNYHPSFRIVDHLEEQLITAAYDQKNFSELCEMVANSLQEEAVNFVAQTILFWINNGLLCYKE